MTAKHILPGGLVRSMSGAGTRQEIDLLHLGQTSKRMVQLRAILDLAERDEPEAARIAGFRASFAALAAVQRRDPTQFAELIGGPQVGAWAGRCLRRLVGPASPTPMWIHLAQLGAIAVAAAVRSGVDMEVLVPVRSGRVALPTLGSAVVERSEQWALARCTSGEPVLFDGVPPLDWQPVRLLRTDRIAVPIDDSDAYWTCFGLPLRPRLTQSQLDQWCRQLELALVILADRHEEWLPTVEAAVRCLVPIEQADRFGGLSASSADAPGAVALTEPASPQRLAATLVHEVQHFRLSALHDLIPLHSKEAGPLVYSPWRNDPRGFPGLLHGNFAFLGVADYWSREWPVAGQAAELMYGKTLRQLRIGQRVLATARSLTPTGTELVDAIGSATTRLPETKLGEDVCRIADDLVAHHRLLWQLRHTVPRPAEVAALTGEWLRGKAVTPPRDPGYHTTMMAAPGGDSPLFRLATGWVDDPDSLRAVVVDQDLFAANYSGADPGDLLLLAGQYAQAQASRLAGIVAGAADETAWASLAVAHSRLCGDSSGSPIAVRPELVRAAWPQVAAAAGDGRDPLTELASRYIGGTSTSDSIRR